MSITPSSALVLKGRISDPTTGAAIAGCAIDALPLNADGTFGAPIGAAATTTNGSGLYSMNVGAASPTGRYVVKVRDPISGKTRYIFPAISMQVDMLYGTVESDGKTLAPLPDASIKTSQYRDASVTYVKLAADVLTGLDTRFVNVTGDTITGTLNVGNLGVAGMANVNEFQANIATINGILSADEIQAPTGYITYLYVGADAAIPGTLTTSTIQAIDVEASGHIAADGNITSNGLGYFEAGVQIAGGAFTVNAAGALEAYADALFNNNVAITGALVLSDGIAAAPGLRFSADPDTGIARIGINTVSLIGNGLEALRAGGSGVSPILGFYGNTGLVKQTVSGSRGSSVALASLLTALANIGLISNASSA